MLHEDAVARTPEERLRIKIDNMRDVSKRQLRGLRGEWLDALNDYRPQTTSDTRRDGVGQNKIQKSQAGTRLLKNGTGNRIASIIDQQIAMMFENNPKAYFLPKDHSDANYAKDLERLTRFRADRINLRQKFIKGGYYSKWFGFQAIHVFSDDNLPNDTDVNCRVLFPESLIIDPKLDSQNPEEGDFVGYDRLVNLEYAKRRWSHKKKKIEEEANKEGENSAFGGVHTSDMLDRELGYNTRGAVEVPFREDEHMVQLTVIWFKDYTTRTVKIKKPIEDLMDSGEVVINERREHVWASNFELYREEDAPDVSVALPKYPYGRHVIKIGNIVLEDFPWGLDPQTGEIKQRSWPIALAVNKLIADAWYGQNECEALRGDQNVADVCLQNIHEHAFANIHPIIEVDSNKINNVSQIRSQINKRVIVTNGKDGFKMHAPASIGGDVFSTLSLAQTNMEVTGGMPSQNLGGGSSGRQTATEIAALQRASRGKIGLYSSFIDELVITVYKLMAETIQFTYDPERVIRILGEGGKMTAIEMSKGIRNVRFDVETEAGSTLPTDKQQKKQDAMDLFGQIGLSYLPNVLDAYEVQNKEEVLSNHQEYQMFLQFQEQQALMQEAQGQPAPAPQ